MSKTGKILSDSEIYKKYFGSGIASKIAVMPEKSLWIPSRHLYLNYTMGGGIPYGKICEIFGGESSGKSLVAMDFGYSAQYLGGIVLWNDAEQCFDPHWAQKNGLDLSKVIIYNETSIEKISDWAADISVSYRAKLTGNEPILIVTDSIAALDCEDNINSSQSDAKAEMGNRAKALYKYVRIRNQLFADLGITVIFINQLRKKVGVSKFEDPDCCFSDTIVPLVGGRALPIGKIVREKIKANVWSYNEKLGIFEPKPIVNWVKKEKLQKGEKWIQIKTNGPGNRNGVFGGIFTENHGVLTAMGWVNVKNLKVGDSIITKYPSIINHSLKDFLYGSFIGDSSLGYREGSTDNTTYYQLQDNENQDYLNWKLGKLSKFITFKKLNTVRGGKYKYKSDYTIEFKLVSNKIKYRDPIRLWDLSTNQSPLTLAIWYMDDGHISRERNQMQISISHSRTDIDKLVEYLNKFGLYCYKGSGSNNRNPRGIKFTVQGAKNFFEYIKRCVPNCMQYKLPEEYKGFYNDFELTSELVYKPVEIKITYIGEASKKSYRKPYKYDLTIEDNHNFLIGGKSNGFIVHNTTPGGDAMKFFASQRLAFFRKKQITEGSNEKKVWIGNEVSVRLKKNKVAPPRPTFTTNIYFHEDYGKIGLDKYDNLAELFERTGTVTRSKGSSRYYYRDEEIANGRDAFQELLETDPELRGKLLRRAKINTISQTQKKIERLQERNENRYPVILKTVKKKSTDDEGEDE